MAEDEGASPRELVVEACRRDQPHLIEDVLTAMPEKSNQEIAAFFNGVKDAMGNYALHICAMYGSWLLPITKKLLLPDDVMDTLFDIQYFECDPLTRTDKETPLHLAVRYANDKNSELGRQMVEMMCDAGCDPRVKNKHGQKPIDIVFGDYTDIKLILRNAEYIFTEGVQKDSDDSDEADGSDSDN
ncbi:hypothetical protein Egran_04110 [Elaphomyces granulatus]|uniref:Uncharacterized protein n=1 Tax=Elaphomyces granulatus TaxID=519963 RepID=A0A232LWE4_9EURO|nr:hypothetical protein Egran_04110 [Elaphomyces granulatus]